MHWSASCYPEEAHWRERLAICREMGIGWIKFVDDGGASGMNVYRACWHEFGIIPVIRFYIGTPGNCGPREEDAIRRIADALGFRTYFELCNEPDLPIEWGYEQPRDWLYRAVNAYVQYAPKVLEAGGLPGTFALASGAFGQMRIDEHGNEIPPTKVNFLKLIHDKNPNILGAGGWVSMHNYHINHPIDYPYDDVNQTGKTLTIEEYNAAPPWAWDNRPMEAINIQRARDKNPGDTIWDDDTCFNAYMVFQAHLQELGLTEVPLITTEGGPTMTRGDDGRYCKTHHTLHADLVEQTYRALGTVPNYFAYCHWLLYNTTGGWGTDCWLGGTENHTLTLARMKDNAVGAWGEVLTFDGTTPEPVPEPIPEPEPPEEEEPLPEPEVVNDAAQYGVVVVPAPVDPGETYWKITRIHHLTGAENNGNHNLFVNVLRDGQPARDAIALAFWGDDNEVQIPLEKPYPAEPMGNIPLWKGQVVEAMVDDDEFESDLVQNIHTAHPDEPPGNTLYHHSFLVEWQLVTKAGDVEPEPPPIPDDPTEQDIRNAAWNLAYPAWGVALNPTAALQAYARANGMGCPVTDEFDAGPYRVQGFALGIVYCEVGDWGNIVAILW